jgi:hypothetical protein
MGHLVFCEQSKIDRPNISIRTGCQKMTTNLLRIEAVNIRYCIDDTEDLSTRRAGGYMLLQAIRDIENKFVGKLEPISTGASIGLFKILPVVTDTKKLVTDVNDILVGSPLYKHATFMVDVIADNEFKDGVEKVIAANRWRQMQSLSFSAQWGNGNGGARVACEFDDVRPSVNVTPNKDGSGKPLAVSASVKDRRDKGRMLRQKFYQTELGDMQPQSLDFSLEDQGKLFTNHTEEMSEFTHADEPWKQLPHNLSGKMAIFYADGNKFGSIQKNCLDDEALKAWDNDLKEKRRILLDGLLKQASKNALWKTADGRIRLETLMWGGDELMFIVPAWVGLELAEFFFEHTNDWKHGEKELTHAVGLVFAHHNAPISRLQKLAKALADQGKNGSLKGKNSLTWITLESFDHAGSELDDYWKRRGLQVDWSHLQLIPETLQSLREKAPALKLSLPRSAMVRALDYFAGGKAFDAEGKPAHLLTRSYKAVEESLNPDERTRFGELWQTLHPIKSEWSAQPHSKDAAVWAILVELRDYLVADASSSAEVAQGADK